MAGTGSGQDGHDYYICRVSAHVPRRVGYQVIGKPNGIAAGVVGDWPYSYAAVAAEGHVPPSDGVGTGKLRCSSQITQKI